MVLLASSLSLTAEEGRPVWEPKQIGGREYLALDSVTAFYGLKPFEWKGDEGTTGNGRVLVDLQVGSTVLSLNRVRLNLSTPVIREEGVPYLSRMDLSKMMDPVLRPGQIEGFVPFKTMILDSSPAGRTVEDAAKREQVPWDLEEVVGKLQGLEKSGGYDAMATFGEGRPVSLDERLQVIANAAKPALVVSVRFTAGTGDEAVLRTWCLSPAGVSDPDRELQDSDSEALPGNANDAINLAAAMAIHGTVKTRLGMVDARDGGVGWSRDPLLVRSASPTIIVEYVSAKGLDPSKVFGSEAGRNALAAGLNEGLNRLNRSAGQAEGNR
jgi:N-acetylmuramoyl-L-alanine amidase